MTTTPSGVPEVKIGDWLSEGWNVFVSDIGMFIIASLIYTILNAICLPIFFGPLTCGMYLMIFDRMEGRRADVKRLFAGFDYFGQSFLAGIIFFVLAILGAIIFFIGFTLCVLPAVIGLALLVLLQTGFLFVFQLIVKEGSSATEAISLSFSKVKENIWQFLLFGFLLWLINAAGYSVMLGWLVTTPLTLAAAGAAYRDVFGRADLQESAAPPEEM